MRAWVVLAFLLVLPAVLAGCTRPGPPQPPGDEVLLFVARGGLDGVLLEGEDPAKLVGEPIAGWRLLDDGTVLLREDEYHEGPANATQGALLLYWLSESTPFKSAAAITYAFLAPGEAETVSLRDRAVETEVRLGRAAGSAGEAAKLFDRTVPANESGESRETFERTYTDEGESWRVRYWVNVTLENRGPVPLDRLEWASTLRGRDG